jgi:hypothetical protein
MTANEDPAPQFPAAERPADDLEDWLSDLRTEGPADPSGWIEEEPADESNGGGRHRAPE